MLHLLTAHRAPFFLQAIEATKALAEATGNVTKQAASHGEATTIYWWLALLFFIAACILAVLLYKSEKGKAGEIQAARTEWQKEMAINNGNAEEVRKQLKEQYDKQILQLIAEKKDMAQQILDANTELRKQVAKDAQLFEALTNSQRLTARTLHANNANQQEIMRVLGIAYPDAQIRPPYAIDML